ncbi:aminotransferase class III-fold pyridoxal phosphate-dependent enzyme [Helicobacter saguini]|uniref:aminotransferase class III-fold pyridoxal phosphate-dependent enzyme n=1 Tax=Helicobacter saguini TaxID=1548018 RepID=UPI003B02BE2C
MESKTQDSKKDTESTLQDSKDSHKSIESKSQNNIDSKNLANLDSKKSSENIESKNADSTKIDSNISHKFIESNSQDSTKMNSKNSQNNIDSANHIESSPKIKKTTAYCLSELEKILNTNADKIAAFILEPLVQCAGNMNMYPHEFVKKACEMCRNRGILVIFDEIATGFGRTGRMFAFEHCNFVPDFLCLSKGISGGYLPLSVVVTRQNIYRAFYHNDIKKAFLHSHSYTGNALACAAANASLDIFEKRDILAKNAKKSAYIWAGLSAILAKDSIKSKVKNVRYQGMIFAFDLNTEFLESQNSQDSKNLGNLDSKKNIESNSQDSKNSHKNIESNLQNIQDSKNIESKNIDSIKIDSKNPKIDVSLNVQHDKHIESKMDTSSISQHKNTESKKNYGYIFYKKALKKGLLLRPLGNTIYLMPPYIITKKQINYILKTIKKILKKL